MDRVTRPKAVVLPESALVRDKRTREFTHEVTQAQPYFPAEAGQSNASDGRLDAGAKVVLLRQDGDWCYVTTADGRHIKIAGAALRRL